MRLLADEGEVVSGYVFELGCLHCGGPLTHQADGRAHTNTMRSEIQAVANCETCRRPHRITVLVSCVKSASKIRRDLEHGKFVDTSRVEA